MHALEVPLPRVVSHLIARQAEDYATAIGTQDSVGGRLPLEREGTADFQCHLHPFFALTQRLFGPFAFGDVAANGGQANGFALRVPNVEDVINHPQRLAGLEVAEAEFHLRTALRATHEGRTVRR